MKGKLLKVLAVLGCLALGAGFASCGEDGNKNSSSEEPFSSEGLVYTLNEAGDAYSVTGYEGTATKVQIPSVYQDLPVTSIDKSAFSESGSLTSIEISDSVTSIGDSAFYNCVGLTSVEIPDSVTSIGSGAFYNCDGLTSVEIPDSVTSISSAAFSGCSGLTSVEIPDSVTSIGGHAFYECRSLTSVNIPDSVTSIGGNAFSECTGLTSVNIPDSVTSIGGHAFYECRSLTGVYITDIAAWYNISFGNMYANPLYYAGDLYLNKELITELIIPDSVTSIGEYAFCNCDSLTKIVIPDSVTSIGSEVFKYCSSLTSVLIGDSVTSIGENAFDECSSLTIYCEAKSRPEGWNSSWNYSGCPVVWRCNNNDVANDGYIYTVVDGVRYRLKDGVATVVRQPTNIGVAYISKVVMYKGVNYTVTSIGWGAFWFCSSLTEIVISDSVTSIDASAFEGCSGLTKVVIPDSVTKIGGNAFQRCTNLTIYCEAKSQPEGWSSYWNYYSNRPVVWGYKGE